MSDAPGGGGAAADRALGVLLALPALAVVAFALAGPIVSGDLFWHLSTGHWILEHGELPETDPFSHTAGDKPWTLEEYGAQVLFAALEDAGGPALLRAAGAVLGAALVVTVFLVSRRRLPGVWPAATTALFALLFALKCELRPHLLSAFFLLRLAHVLFPPERARDPGPRVWTEVFVLSVLWTQLHAEAIFAPMLAVAGLIGAVLGGLVEREGGPARVRAWLVVVAAAAAGTLLSPEGWNQHLYALSDSAVPREYIEEWFRSWVLPGDVRFAPLTVPLFAAVAAGIAVGGAFVLSRALARARGERRGMPWERIGFLAVCVLLAILARRFFWLLWFPLVDAFALALAARPRLARARFLPAAAALLLAMPLAGTHYPLAAWRNARQGTWNRAVDTALFPVRAAELAREAGLEGNLFHPYEWGGYLGHELWPRCRVYLDGRTVLHAEAIPERWRAERWEALGRAEETARLLRRRDVRVVVMRAFVDHGAGPRPWRPPGAHEEWVRAWADPTAVVWIRRDDAANLERVRALWSARGIAFDPADGFLEAQVLEAHPDRVSDPTFLAPEVAHLLAPLYRDEAWSGPGRALDRARVLFAARMGRSARWELGRYVDWYFAGDAEARRAWRARVRDGKPEGLLAELPGPASGPETRNDP